MFEPTDNGLLRASLAEEDRETNVKKDAQSELRTALFCALLGLTVFGGTFFTTDNFDLSAVVGGAVGFLALGVTLGGRKPISD